MSRQSDLSIEIDRLLAQQALPPLEILLRMVKQSGCRLNNLFQRMDGQYQANLRDARAQMFFEFAWGVSPGDAVLKALKKVAEGKVAPRTRVSDDEADPTEVGSTTAQFNNSSPPDEDATASDVDAVQPAADEDDLIG